MFMSLLRIINIHGGAPLPAAQWCVERFDPRIPIQHWAGGSYLKLSITKYTGGIRIQCRATVGLISGRDYYEFGVNEMRQSGLIWSRLGCKSASQIKTSKTLVVVQTNPTIA